MANGPEIARLALVVEHDQAKVAAAEIRRLAEIGATVETQFKRISLGDRAAQDAGELRRQITSVGVATNGTEAQAMRMLRTTGRMEIAMAAAATGVRGGSSAIIGMTSALGALGPQMAVIAGAVGIAGLVWQKYSRDVEAAVNAHIEAVRRFNESRMAAAGPIVEIDRTPAEAEAAQRKRIEDLRTQVDEVRRLAEQYGRLEQSMREVERSPAVPGRAGSLIGSPRQIAGEVTNVGAAERNLERLQRATRWTETLTTAIRAQGQAEQSLENMRENARRRASSSGRDPAADAVRRQMEHLGELDHLEVEMHNARLARIAEIRLNTATAIEDAQRAASESWFERALRESDGLLARIELINREIIDGQERESMDWFNSQKDGGGGLRGFLSGQGDALLTGLVSGITSAVNPVGLLTSSVTEMAASLFGASEQAKQAAEAERQLQAARAEFRRNLGVSAGALGYAFDETTREVGRTTDGRGRERQGRTVTDITLRSLTGLDRALGENSARFAEMEAEARRLFAAGQPLNDQMRRIALLRAAEAERIRAEYARVQREAREDLSVRALAAMGLDAEAEAMRFALEQQREYEQAIRDGEDAATLAARAQVLLAEAQRRAADVAIAAAEKEQQAARDRLSSAEQNLASSRQTLDSLRAFQRSLGLLGASPAAGLGVQRQSFEDVAARALTGDTGAQAQYQAVAQAFLDASRSYNASGLGFQRDLARVQEVTAKLGDRFQEQVSIEQQIVDLLKAQHDALTAQLETLRAAEAARQSDAARAAAQAAADAARAIGDTAGLIAALEQLRAAGVAPADAMISSLLELRDQLGITGQAIVDANALGLLENRNAVASAATAQIAAIREGADDATIAQLGQIAAIEQARLDARVSATGVAQGLLLLSSSFDAGSQEIINAQAAGITANLASLDAATARQIAAMREGASTAELAQLEQIAALERQRLDANTAALEQTRQLALSGQLTGEQLREMEELRRLQDAAFQRQIELLQGINTNTGLIRDWTLTPNLPPPPPDDSGRPGKDPYAAVVAELKLLREENKGAKTEIVELKAAVAALTEVNREGFKQTIVEQKTVSRNTGETAETLRKGGREAVA